MGDPEHSRLQGCIDECNEDIKSIERSMTEITTEVAVLKSIVVGNGRPGLVAMFEKTSAIVEDISERLSRIEHSKQAVRLRRNDLIRDITTVVAVLGLLATVAAMLFK